VRTLALRVSSNFPLERRNKAKSLSLVILVLMCMNTALLKLGVRVWLIETIVSGFNFFVLMGLIYEPIWGELGAHQIGMSTRIVYIFFFAYFMLRYAKRYDTRDLLTVGFLWLGLELLFEWGGSLAVGRPVQEILVGWNISLHRYP
jgi:hypothetical protein